MRYLDRDKVAQNIRARMAGDLAAARVGGAGICVMQNSQVVFKEYFGKMSADGPEIGPVEAGNRVMFRLASMTKPITAAAALMQIERGLLDADTPVSQWLPAFGEMDVGHMTPEGKVERIGKARHPITLRNLLNHTNGLGTGSVGIAEMARMSSADWRTPGTATDFLAGTALAFDPTTSQEYSPTAAFIVVSRLVEVTSGLPFDQFIRENLTDPCGMKDTTFAPTEEQWSRCITMHSRENGKNVDLRTFSGCVFENIPVTNCCGGAGLASTLPDYVRFAEMLCRGGVTVDGKRILSEASVRAMGTPSVPGSIMPGPIQWGLGVRVITAEDYQMPKACFGWSGAYGTHFWVDPENQITAVYMKNCKYDGGSGARTSFLFEQDVYSGLHQ